MGEQSFVSNSAVVTLFLFCVLSAVWLGIVALLGVIFNPRVKELEDQEFTPTLLASVVAGIMVVVFLVFTARDLNEGVGGFYLWFVMWMILLIACHIPASLVADKREFAVRRQERARRLAANRYWDQSYGVCRHPEHR